MKCGCSANVGALAYLIVLRVWQGKLIRRRAFCVLLSGEMWGLQDVEGRVVLDLMIGRIRIPKGRRIRYVMLDGELFMEEIQYVLL